MFKEQYREQGSLVESDTVIGNGTQIGAFSIIRSGVFIGKNTVIGNHVYIGESVDIGENCIICDYACVGHNADGLFTDTQFDPQKGFGRIKIHDNVTIMNYVKIEPPVLSTDETVIEEYVHIGHGSYVKEASHIGSYTNIGAFCLIGEHSVTQGHCLLGNRTTVGAYTLLKEGCNALNACLFENNKTYGAGWYGSLRPAITGRQYVKTYRNERGHECHG